MKRRIEKDDGYGSAKLTVEHPNDDLYLYLRISGAYFMIFAFLAGILTGIGISIFIYHLFS